MTQPRAGCYGDSSHWVCQTPRKRVLGVGHLCAVPGLKPLGGAHGSGPCPKCHSAQGCGTAFMAFGPPSLSQSRVRKVPRPSPQRWRSPFCPAAVPAGDDSGGCAEPRRAPPWWQQQHDGGSPALHTTTHLARLPLRPLQQKERQSPGSCSQSQP